MASPETAARTATATATAPPDTSTQQQSSPSTSTAQPDTPDGSAVASLPNARKHGGHCSILLLWLAAAVSPAHTIAARAAARATAEFAGGVRIVASRATSDRMQD